MAFHVNWKPSVKDRIMEIWMAASDRASVTAAIDLIDQPLRTDPLSFGEQRPGCLRLGFALPLIVMFAVFPDDLRVDVVGIRRMDKPTPPA